MVLFTSFSLHKLNFVHSPSVLYKQCFEVLVALASQKFDEHAIKLPINAIGIRAGIGQALVTKKPHLVSREEDKTCEIGRVVKHGTDELNPEGFTLGQLYAGISVIQRYARGYLSRLRKKIQQLHERERAGQPKIVAVTRLQRWYRRCKVGHRHRELAQALTEGVIRKFSSSLEKKEEESTQSPDRSVDADGTLVNFNMKLEIEAARADADRAIKHAAEVTLQHALMKEQHARELAHFEYVIGREKAASRLQHWYRRQHHKIYSQNVARALRSEMNKLLERENSITDEVEELKEKLVEAKSALNEALTSNRKNDEIQAKEEMKEIETDAPRNSVTNQFNPESPPPQDKSVDSSLNAVSPTPVFKQVGGGAMKLQERSPPTPYWKSDSHRKVCSSCGNQFTWLRRQHHCRLCGDLFCNDCSMGQRVLPMYLTASGPEKNKTGQAFRVCDGCGEDFDRGNRSTGHDAHIHHYPMSRQREAKSIRKEAPEPALKSHPQVSNTDAWGV